MMKLIPLSLFVLCLSIPVEAHRTEAGRVPADTCQCARATVPARIVKPRPKPANTVPKRPPVESPHPPYQVPVDPPAREVRIEREIIREIERERTPAPSVVVKESRTGLVLGLLGAVALGAVIASCGDEDGARVSVSVGGGASPKPAPGDCKPGKKKRHK
ncbi:MAG: hypothetical protein ACKVW3_01780 [Phycisphaerales bacterium]